MNRLWIALTLYGVLALLVWQTITDEKVRAITFIILAGFALRTLAHRRQGIRPAAGSDSDHEPM